MQITRQNSDVAPGHKRADSGFEFLGLARSRSSAFRKYNQNVARIREKFGTNGKALANVCLSREGQRVDHDGRDPGTRHASKKVVRRRRRKSAVQLAQRQRREEAEGIEVARMIRHHDERTVGAQMFVPDDFKAVISAQPHPNEQRHKRTQSIDEHVGLARETPQAIDRREIDILCGIVMPSLHRNP